MPQWLRVAWSNLPASGPRPLAAGLNAGQLPGAVNCKTTAGLNASVALVEGLAEVVLHTFKSGSLPAGKQVFHVFQQPPLVFLVSLDRQDVIGFPAHNPLGYLLLTTHRVDGGDATRQVQQVQQFGDCGDFISPQPFLECVWALALAHAAPCFWWPAAEPGAAYDAVGADGAEGPAVGAAGRVVA